MKIINLTPHDINILITTMKKVEDFGQWIEMEDTTIITIPASGAVARCKVERKITGYINNIPETHTVFGEVEGLPEPQDGIIYIVSSLVAQAVKRDDIYIPDDVVRDGTGKIVGCKSLGKI